MVFRMQECDEVRRRGRRGSATYSAGGAATERSSLRQTEVLTVARARARPVQYNAAVRGMGDAYRGRRGRRLPRRDGQRSPGCVGVEFLIVTDRGPQRARARARAPEDLSVRTLRCGASCVAHCCAFRDTCYFALMHTLRF